MKVPVNPVETTDEGKIRLNLAADELNDDWIRSARLLREGKKEEYAEKDGKSLYYDMEDEEEEE